MRQHDPDTTPVGRQPLLMKWTPSKAPSPWYGAIEGYEKGEMAQVGGMRFTNEQYYALRVLGLDPGTVPAMLVKRQSTPEEIWTPSGDMPSVFAFECPVLGTAPDGRIRVIAPGGSQKLVQPDGWTVRPRTYPRWSGY